MNLKRYLITHITGDFRLHWVAAPAIAGLGGAAASGFAVTSAVTGLATTVGTATALSTAAGYGLLGAGAATAVGSSGGSLLSLVGSGLSAASTISGGLAHAGDLKAQAKAEKFNAATREIDRKRNLIRALSLQNVRVGAGGIQGGQGSSAQAIQLADIKDYELDQAVDKAGTSQRVNQLRQNATNAVTSSLISAAGEGIGTYGRYKKRGSL